MDDYLELIKQFPLRQLKSSEDFDAANGLLDSLVDRLDELTRGESEYLHVLGMLIEEYEERHCPMPEVSAPEMLRHLIDARGTTQSEVATATGLSPSVISEIISGKRQMNLGHIKVLAAHFKVSQAVFIGR